MPNVIANQIIGVQPMTGPVGSFFALKTRYDIVPSTIWQLTKLSYKFYSSSHPEILDWLEDCVWSYTIWSERSDVWRTTMLVFDDIQGSVEFKVRF